MKYYDKDKKEKIEEFHNDKVIRVLLMTGDKIKRIIKKTIAQTIISFDLEWTPGEIAKEIVSNDTKNETENKNNLKEALGEKYEFLIAVFNENV